MKKPGLAWGWVRESAGVVGGGHCGGEIKNLNIHVR